MKSWSLSAVKAHRTSQREAKLFRYKNKTQQLHTQRREERKKKKKKKKKPRKKGRKQHWCRMARRRWERGEKSVLLCETLRGKKRRKKKNPLAKADNNSFTLGKVIPSSSSVHSPALLPSPPPPPPTNLFIFVFVLCFSFLHFFLFSCLFCSCLLACYSFN